jgi:hypothetical protein
VASLGACKHYLLLHYLHCSYTRRLQALPAGERQALLQSDEGKCLLQYRLLNEMSEDGQSGSATEG